MNYFSRLLAGELDVAVVLLPEGKTAPPPLLTNIIASDRMEIVQGAAGNVDGDWKSLGRAPWVLNPPGCFLRASLIDRMERAGFTPMIAAEVHNMHMQLAFVQSGYGVGLLPARFIARNHSIDPVKVLRPPSFDLHRSVAIVRVGQLGALGKAVELLAHGFRQLFEAADTRKPVTRQPKSCARESAGGATAQVVPGHRLLQLSGIEDILSSVLDRREDRARRPATHGRASINLAGRPRDELVALLP